MFVNVENEVTKKRMETLCTSNDGFYISEQDLKIRGPGDFFGTRQHGIPELKVANLFSDGLILNQAQECAKKIMDGQYKFSDYEIAVLTKKVENILPEDVVLN